MNGRILKLQIQSVVEWRRRLRLCATAAAAEWQRVISIINDETDRYVSVRAHPKRGGAQTQTQTTRAHRERERDIRHRYGRNSGRANGTTAPHYRSSRSDPDATEAPAMGGAHAPQVVRGRRRRRPSDAAALGSAASSSSCRVVARRLRRNCGLRAPFCCNSGGKRRAPGGGHSGPSIASQSGRASE